MLSAKTRIDIVQYGIAQFNLVQFSGLGSFTTTDNFYLFLSFFSSASTTALRIRLVVFGLLLRLQIHALTAHVHRQRLVGQRLAHAQVGGHVNQVAIAWRQAQYSFRLQLVHVAAALRFNWYMSECSGISNFTHLGCFSRQRIYLKFLCSVIRDAPKSMQQFV